MLEKIVLNFCGERLGAYNALEIVLSDILVTFKVFHYRNVTFPANKMQPIYYVSSKA